MSFFMVGCVFDCVKVRPSCAVGDSSTVQSSTVDTVGPWGGGRMTLELVECFVRGLEA